MNIVITGGGGFIGKNLRVALAERGFSSLKLIFRTTSQAELRDAVDQADVIFHLAGEMRPTVESDFVEGNVRLTKDICIRVASTRRPIKIVFASSFSIDLAPDTIYSKSKLEAENILKDFAHSCNAPVCIYRLPHVFGKWAKPFYNSIIATTCYSVSRAMPVNIHDPNSLIYPLHIDSLIDQFCEEINFCGDDLFSMRELRNVRTISVGKLYEVIKSFASIQTDLEVGEVGSGLLRDLYLTYVSYLPESKFSYPLKRQSDPNGVFVNFFRTKSIGQFSYFTLFQGASWKRPCHQTSTEKFLVVQGRAEFLFRNVLTGNIVNIDTSSDDPVMVDYIPGWTLEIKNVGDCTLILIMWINEAREILALGFPFASA